jgi:LCP family protein required for cell wall assembly
VIRGVSSLRVAVVVCGILGLLAVSTLALATNQLGAKVRLLEDPFGQIPEHERPAGTDGSPGDGTLNILVAGIDVRSSDPTTGANATGTLGGRADAVMIVHLTRGLDRAYVVSIPRDAWVPVPGHGSTKVNASFALGGPALYIRTIEQLTGIRIDHIAIVDFAGFKAITDAMGGVTVRVPADSYDRYRKVHWEAGEHHLSGAEALNYVGQRAGLPRGDMDRVQRQQAFVRSVLREMLSERTLANPVTLARTLEAITDSVSVDTQMSNARLRSLALALRRLQASDVTFVTAPVDRLDEIDGESVVRLDSDEGPDFWHAVATDQLETYIRTHRVDALGELAP